MVRRKASLHVIYKPRAASPANRVNRSKLKTWRRLLELDKRRRTNATGSKKCQTLLTFCQAADILSGEVDLRSSYYPNLEVLSALRAEKKPRSRYYLLRAQCAGLSMRG